MNYFLGLFLIFSINIFQWSKSETVNVAIYYEVLCPDSINFIKYQFYPAYKKIGSSLKVDFVPYGNAKQWKDEDGKWNFQCQHGRSECYGNKIHACVFSQTIPEATKAKFVNCHLSSWSPISEDIIKKCMNQINLSWKTINECATGEEGDKLLAQYGDITNALEPPLNYVPRISINGYFNGTLNWNLEHGFLKFICDTFSEIPGCSETNNSGNTKFINSP